MSDAEPTPSHPDDTVKIPLPYLLVLIITLLVTFVYLIQHSRDRVFVASAFVVLSLMAAAITFGALGASAQVKTKLGQFGGSAGVLIAMFLMLQSKIPPAAHPLLYGKVTSAGSPEQTIEGAEVKIRVGPDVYPRQSDKNGIYKFPIPPQYENMDVEVNGAAPPGYGPCPSKHANLGQDGATIDLELTPIGRLAESTRATTQPTIAWESSEIALHSLPPGPLVHHPRILAGPEIYATDPIPPSPTATAPAAVNDLAVPAASDTVPVTFSFDYQFDDPGVRTWHRLTDRSWVETFPSGRQELFRETGRTTVEGDAGTIITSRESDKLEIFVPDKNAKLQWTRFRQGGQAWSFLGEMQNVH